MRRVLVLSLAFGLLTSMPVLAADHEHMTLETTEGVRQCALQAETIQEQVKRLETEIAKGTNKYGSQDLKKLEKELKDANEFIDQMNRK